ncbi:MAG: FliA/WhiG family RNA polymerase sigma factor [bacterium]
MTEEEQWREYKRTNDPKIREELILKYVPLVKYIAGRVAIGAPNFDYNDLISYGIIGLIDAIEKFDPNQGFVFQTYASKRIRGAIIDELRALDWVPRLMRKRAKELEDTYIKLEKRYGRPATEEEVCEELEITKEEFNQILLDISGTTIISLDEVWYITEDNYKILGIETIKAPQSQNPEVIMEKEEVKDILAGAISRLSEKERETIALYYYEDLTLKEIGKVLNVTESRACQLHANAITKLKASIKKKIADFTK